MKFLLPSLADGLMVDFLSIHPVLLIRAGSEFVFIDSHRGLSVQISDNPALRHQFQRDLIFQARRPIHRNLEQLPGLKRFLGGKQQAFAADVQCFAGCHARQKRMLERLITDRQPAGESGIGSAIRPAAFRCSFIVSALQCPRNRPPQFRRIVQIFVTDEIVRAFTHRVNGRIAVRRVAKYDDRGLRRMLLEMAHRASPWPSGRKRSEMIRSKERSCMIRSPSNRASTHTHSIFPSKSSRREAVDLFRRTLFGSDEENRVFTH